MDFSFVGKGSNLRGVFIFKGTTYLNAKLDGDITIEDNGHFIVEDEGSLKGTLRGYDVDIFGTFDGILESSGKVIIHSTACVSGEIKADRLVVRPNSLVNVKARTKE